MVIRLDFYAQEELQTIVSRSAQLLQIGIDEAGTAEIARRSRGTPRIANRLPSACVTTRRCVPTVLSRRRWRHSPCSSWR